MANTSLFGVDPVSGRSKWNILDHTGPTTYTTGGETLGQSAFGGPNLLGLSSYDVIHTALSNSGNYRVDCLYGAKGIRSSVNLVWSFSGLGGAGVGSVSFTAGTGQTNGTFVINGVGGGGTGAQVTIIIAGGLITSAVVTSPGKNYTSAPTFTVAEGGTPGTVTAVLSTPGQQVPAGANLSGETIRLLAIGG